MITANETLVYCQIFPAIHKSSAIIPNHKAVSIIIAIDTGISFQYFHLNNRDFHVDLQRSTKNMGYIRRDII